MYGYGGMGRYYVNRAQPAKCSNCDGTGREETENITIDCQYCNGTGIPADPKLSRAAWIGIAAVLVGGYGAILWFALS